MGDDRLSITEDVAAAITYILLACPTCQPAVAKLRELESTAECLGAAFTGRLGADAILRRVGELLALEVAALRN